MSWILDTKWPRRTSFSKRKILRRGSTRTSIEESRKFGVYVVSATRLPNLVPAVFYSPRERDLEMEDGRTVEPGERGGREIKRKNDRGKKRKNDREINII